MTRPGRPPWPERAERIARYKLIRRDPTVTVAQAAVRLGVTPRTVHRYAAELRKQETAMALEGQIDAALRTGTPVPGSAEEARASHVLHMPAGNPDAEEQERRRAAAFVRRTTDDPEPILDALGLLDVAS